MILTLSCDMFDLVSLYVLIVGSITIWAIIKMYKIE